MPDTSRQTAMRKAAEKQGAAPVAQLTPSELATVRLNIAPPRGLRFGTLKEIRHEMQRIYRLVCDGKIPLQAGTKLIYILERIQSAKSDEEKIEIMRKAGIAGEPFIGMKIVGPKSQGEADV